MNTAGEYSSEVQGVLLSESQDELSFLLPDIGYSKRHHVSQDADGDLVLERRNKTTELKLRFQSCTPLETVGLQVSFTLKVFFHI